MSRHRRPPAPRSAVRWLVGVVIAVLAAATAVLVVLALTSVRPTVAAAGSPVPDFTEWGAGPTASSSPSPTPTPTATPAAVDPSAERFLSIGSGGWWRASAGACGEVEPRVERSTDAGATWTDVTPRYRGIGQVAALDAFAGTEAEMVASMGTACETQALRTFTQGRFWESYPEVLAGARFADPADADAVALAGELVAAPCAEPQGFRAAGDTLALVCDGSAYVRTDDAWAVLAAPAVLALAAVDDAVVTASLAPGCAGVSVTRWEGDAFDAAAPVGCAAEVDPTAPIAVAVAADEVWIWAGDALVSVGG